MQELQLWRVESIDLSRINHKHADHPTAARERQRRAPPIIALQCSLAPRVERGVVLEVVHHHWPTVANRLPDRPAAARVEVVRDGDLLQVSVVDARARDRRDTRAVVRHESDPCELEVPVLHGDAARVLERLAFVANAQEPPTHCERDRSHALQVGDPRVRALLRLLVPDDAVELQRPALLVARQPPAPGDPVRGSVGPEHAMAHDVFVFTFECSRDERLEVSAVVGMHEREVRFVRAAEAAGGKPEERVDPCRPRDGAGDDVPRPRRGAVVFGGREGERGRRIGWNEHGAQTPMIAEDRQDD